MKKLGMLLGVLVLANAAFVTVAPPAQAQETTCGAPECGCVGSPGQEDFCDYVYVGNGCSTCN